MSHSFPPSPELTGNSPVNAATQWIEGLLSGSMMTALAALAIAGIGLTMLSGRVSARKGIRVIAGCFILFGAQTIAQGLVGLAWDTDQSQHSINPPEPLPTMPLPKPSPQNPDPYAGASVPQQ